MAGRVEIYSCKVAVIQCTPADFSEEDVERHRRMARMGRNEAHGAPHFVTSWAVTGGGGYKGKIRATFPACPTCNVVMAEKKFNGQRTEATCR